MEESQELRVIALFVILIVSFIGVSLPTIASYFFKGRTDPTNQVSYHHIVKILGAVGCGCIIATGLCHIAPEGSEKLAETLGEYPSFFAIATGTIVVLYMIEKELALAVERRVHALKHRDHSEEHKGKEDPVAPMTEAVDGISPTESNDSAQAEEEALERMHNALVTHILEVGVAVHSILIGVALGLLTDVEEIRPLFIALVFHQFCEGAAIGASVLESGLGVVHTGLMWALFVLTTPLGVAIGIGVEHSQGGEQSEEAVKTQGILEAIAFGILMYMGMVDMLPHLFNLKGCGGHGHGHGHQHAYLPFWYRLLVYFFFALGAAAMVLIAKWA